MGYYAIVTDKDIFRDFVCEEREYCSLIYFEEKDKLTFSDLVLKQFFKENPQYGCGDNILTQFFVNVLNENGVSYIVNLMSGEFTESGRTSVKRFIGSFYRHNAFLAKRKEKSDLIKSRYGQNTVVNKRSPIPAYKKFTYFDAERGIEIPFRFSSGRKKGKKPLLVYLHGAGSTGSDNFRQLAEFMTSGIKLKEDCFVLLPQCSCYTGENVRDINAFTLSVRSLVEKLAQSCPVDTDRIYVTGVSYGGACTWYSVYNNPGFYAAALPLMGYMPDAYSEAFDVRAFGRTKIWAGHAKDDKAVPADSDLNIYRKIKDVCDARLSLYEEGGHRMMKYFYRKEKWEEWMFAQKRI